MFNISVGAFSEKVIKIFDAMLFYIPVVLFYISISTNATLEFIFLKINKIGFI